MRHLYRSGGFAFKEKAILLAPTLPVTVCTATSKSECQIEVHVWYVWRLSLRISHNNKKCCLEHFLLSLSLVTIVTLWVSFVFLKCYMANHICSLSIGWCITILQLIAARFYIENVYYSEFTVSVRRNGLKGCFYIFPDIRHPLV